MGEDRRQSVIRMSVQTADRRFSRQGSGFLAARRFCDCWIRRKSINVRFLCRIIVLPKSLQRPILIFKRPFHWLGHHFLQLVEFILNHINFLSNWRNVPSWSSCLERNKHSRCGVSIIIDSWQGWPSIRFHWRVPNEHLLVKVVLLLLQVIIPSGQSFWVTDELLTRVRQGQGVILLTCHQVLVLASSKSSVLASVLQRTRI